MWGQVLSYHLGYIISQNFNFSRLQKRQLTASMKTMAENGEKVWHGSLKARPSSLPPCSQAVFYIKYLLRWFEWGCSYVWMFSPQLMGLSGRSNECGLLGVGVPLGMCFAASKAYARSSQCLSPSVSVCLYLCLSLLTAWRSGCEAQSYCSKIMSVYFLPL